MIRLTLILALALSVLGCTGKSAIDKIGSYRMEMRPDGSWSVERGDAIHTRVESPPDAAGPTTQSVGSTSIDTSIAGTWQPPEKPLLAYGLERQATIFYGGSVVIAVCAVVAFAIGWRALSFGLGGLAGALALTPTFVNSYGVYIVGAGLLLLAASGLWAIRGRLSFWREHQSAVDSGQKLANEGKPLEAIAALRESPAVRKAWGN